MSKLSFGKALTEVARALRKSGFVVKNPLSLLPIESWVNSSGPIWATERCKNLKVVALELLAGNTVNIPDWTKKTKYKGQIIPDYPIFKVLVACISADNWRGVRLCLSVLNLYHLLKGPNRAKVVESIDNLSTPFDPIYERHQEAYLPYIDWFFDSLNFRFEDSDFKPRFFSSKVAELPGKNSRFDSILHRGTVPRTISHRVQRVTGYTRNIWLGGDPGPEDFFGGNIHVIHESGMKQRIIVIPSVWVQWSLDPLKHQLLGLLKGIWEDATHDQDSAVRFLKRNQGKGYYYAVDLSAATDNFPKLWQRHFLERAGVPIDLLDTMFELQYSFEGYNRFVKYERGQAMGLGPSFALFALTHHAILRGICKLRKLAPRSCYRILGDDIVILDNNVYKDYRQVLHDCGIPISVKKSINSNRLSEFAGKILWKGRDVTPIKWRNLTVSNVAVNAFAYTRIGLNPINLFTELSPYIRAVQCLPTNLGGISKDNKFHNPSDPYIRGLVNHRLSSFKKQLSYVVGVEKLKQEEILTQPGSVSNREDDLRIIQDLVTFTGPTDPKILPLHNLAKLSPSYRDTMNSLLEAIDHKDQLQLVPSVSKERFWTSSRIGRQRLLDKVSETRDRLSDLSIKELLMSQVKSKRAGKEYILNSQAFKLPPGIYSLKELKARRDKIAQEYVGLFMMDSPEYQAADDELRQFMESLIEDVKVRLVLPDSTIEN